MKNKSNIKSFLLGAATGVTALFLIGAATRQPFIDEIFPLRFRVLAVSRHGEPTNGRQTTVLRLAPHYGKIDKKSYDFRRKFETPEITVVTMVDTGYAIRTNDIIDFRAAGHLKDSDK